ncbi:DUF6969 family protein [Magnetospirillum gryphiswaldense]|uniref:DUF6969 domain-containing protein n=1 Tax=Magnetospirillum gryphiswaldense TaxID=55518 RepID=A4U4B5_9PROT|nr:hypothetical protein [Magnetospirillum gryphiswaldense]AVM76333.1 hypothetical protein MSR1_38800 [Magnetospirillum gryphiswaldense MSR-1]AVM80236.1 hypothetical protein MSR1L_38800 [Magnetospirillum gryphiswaldense]CAM77722.1 conserved hypothetical protein [Magnetospirillum gryphiswaldense MSR-1]
MTGALTVLEDSLRRDGLSPLDLLGDGAGVVPFAHYPDGDLYDRVTRSQAYFHVHAAGMAGHFHLFLRPGGMPPGMVALAGPTDAPAHLGAIALDDQGWPVAVFATNRWVTGEAWYGGADIIRMLPCFRLDLPAPFARLGQWLTAFVATHGDVLARLALLRERELGDGGMDDESLEVLARLSLL